MNSPLSIRGFALVAVLPLVVACARGNHTEGGGYGGEAGFDGATATSSSSGSTGTSMTATSTSSGGPVCGDGTVDPGEECDGAAPAGKACIGCSIVAVVSPVINEIVYDTSGTDVGCFIEILGPPGLDLTGYTLDAVNGSDGIVAAVASLAGHTLGASGYFVLAQDATVSVAAGSNKLLKAAADLQNGPDSVVLKSGGAIVDALGYGSFAAGQFFAGEKLSAPATSGSLCRIPSGKDSGDNSVDFVACAPTPGASNKLSP